MENNSIYKGWDIIYIPLKKIKGGGQICMPIERIKNR